MFLILFKRSKAMFKLKNLLFCASILAFSAIICNEDNDCVDKAILVNETKHDGNTDLSDNQDMDLDFIDELIEAPKNADAKPSTFRIPDVVREYGMRGLELMFYLKHSAGSGYEALIRNLKTIYYRV